MSGQSVHIAIRTTQVLLVDLFFDLQRAPRAGENLNCNETFWYYHTYPTLSLGSKIQFVISLIPEFKALTQMTRLTFCASVNRHPLQGQLHYCEKYKLLFAFFSQMLMLVLPFLSCSRLAQFWLPRSSFRNLPCILICFDTIAVTSGTRFILLFCRRQNNESGDKNINHSAVRHKSGNPESIENTNFKLNLVSIV